LNRKLYNVCYHYFHNRHTQKHSLTNHRQDERVFQILKDINNEEVKSPCSNVDCFSDTEYYLFPAIYRWILRQVQGEDISDTIF
jgi:hypothetical protein